MKKNPILIIIPVVVLVGLGIYYFYWWNINKPYKPVPPPVVKSSEEIKTAAYSNQDHNITLKYPASWDSIDLGGEKNVTKSETRENIILIYDPKNLLDKSDKTSGQAGVKILRFLPGEGKTFSSEDDWYNYIKDKVNSYTNDLGKSTGYSLIALNKTSIDGRWAVEEKYYEPAGVQAKDIYIYNKEKHEFYQLICNSRKEIFDQLLPYFDLIVNSFKIENK